MCFLLGIGLLICGFCVAPSNAAGFSAVVDLATGYDDNAPLAATPQGSAFAAYGLALQHVVPPSAESLAVEWYVAAQYRDYFRLPDTGRLTAGATLYASLFQDRLQPAITAETTAYRDDMLPEEEHDEILAAVSVEWLTSGRLTLAATQSWSRRQYRNLQPVLGQGRGFRLPVPGRDDDHRRTEVAATLFLTPVLQSSLVMEYATNDSSLVRESYLRRGGAFSLVWTPTDATEIVVGAALQRDEFRRRGDGRQRTDTNLSFTWRLNRTLGRDRQFFLEVTRRDNDSTLSTEIYRQTVSQCGLSWYF